VYNRSEIEALAEVLRKYPDIWILSDEIYSKLIYGGAEHFSIAAVSKEIADRTIVVNGVSKTYAMTGWRIGWMAGPEELVSLAGKIQSHTTSCPSSISQEATLKALTSPDGFLDDMRAAYRRRRDLFVELLEDIPGIVPYVPEGAFYLFCEIGELIGKTREDGCKIMSCMDFADYLLDEARVAAVPGGAFGLGGHIRFSFATSDDDIKRGVARIAEAVGKLS
ncbi:MAG: aminotransferase class I/II-fold pyridoxal phosphate-dependent enzyme, partial [bacterium]